MKLTITLTGTTPLLMHNPRMVDPEFEICREIKALTLKKKKTDDDYKQIERLEWYGGIYTAPDSKGTEIVVQPTSKPRKCIIETARITKLGKSVERAVMFSDLNVPLVYEGPKDIDSLFSDGRFSSRLSVRVKGNRVMRCRPKFFPWALTVSGLFLEDAGLNPDELVRIVDLAGEATGIGDNRVNGYGRFTAKVVLK